MEEKIIKDTFGNRLHVGDEVIYTYCHSFVKGRIVKFTYADNVVVDNYPSGEYVYLNGNRSWRRTTKTQSLGRYKECVKYDVASDNLNLTNSSI